MINGSFLNTLKRGFVSQYSILENEKSQTPSDFTKNVKKRNFQIKKRIKQKKPKQPKPRVKIPTHEEQVEAFANNPETQKKIEAAWAKGSSNWNIDDDLDIFGNSQKTLRGVHQTKTRSDQNKDFIL